MTYIHLTSGNPSPDWIEDCMKYWGRVLSGSNAHWCPEWDDLPIDDTCEMEMKCCICEKETKMIDQNTQNEINHAIFNQMQTDKDCPQDLWKAALVALKEGGYEIVEKTGGTIDSTE